MRGSDVMQSTALLGVLAAACAPEVGVELPQTELVWDGAQVRLHAVPELTACSGNGPAMEAMLVLRRRVRPGIAWPDSETLRLEIGAPCEAPTVLGLAEHTTFERFVVEVPAPGPVSVVLSSRPQGRAPRVRMVRCGSCEEEFVLAHDLEGGRLQGAWLRSGRYVVTVDSPTGEPEAGVLELWWE